MKTHEKKAAVNEIPQGKDLCRSFNKFNKNNPGVLGFSTYVDIWRAVEKKFQSVHVTGEQVCEYLEDGKSDTLSNISLDKQE